ncbi:hypothetical protein GcM1_192008 [Golovinomyces cichoracearum]|uniref:Uncharacterized protein n=1 Tax=Golovinomyces cichoracearum TaxID=62708 RepID=A0A420J155_9PEZI|nr:hypothetical protein GcM1_192008 [Golovinomyces cichoracearum]
MCGVIPQGRDSTPAPLISLDLDDPGPSQDYNKSTSFLEDDKLSDNKETHDPIKDALVEFANSAAIRAEEAKAIFSDIACTFDNKYNSLCDSNLSLKQQHAHRIFCKDLTEVASKHFEAYIRRVSAETIGSKLTHLAAPAIRG